MPRNRNNAAGVAVNTGVETPVVVLNGISTTSGNSIDLDANVFMTAGTAAGTYTVRVRRGIDATGALVGAAIQEDFLANGHITVGIQASDVFNADIAGQQYVLTVQQASGQTCTATVATIQQLY